MGGHGLGIYEACATHARKETANDSQIQQQDLKRKSKFSYERINAGNDTTLQCPTVIKIEASLQQVDTTFIFITYYDRAISSCSFL